MHHSEPNGTRKAEAPCSITPEQPAITAGPDPPQGEQRAVKLEAVAKKLGKKRVVKAHSQTVLLSTGAALSMQFPISFSQRCRRPIYRRRIDRPGRPDAAELPRTAAGGRLFARGCLELGQSQRCHQLGNSPEIQSSEDLSRARPPRQPRAGSRSTQERVLNHRRSQVNPTGGCRERARSAVWTGFERGRAASPRPPKGVWRRSGSGRSGEEERERVALFVGLNGSKEISAARVACNVVNAALGHGWDGSHDHECAQSMFLAVSFL
nr:unnamed protein product [Digitaria exilis]